MSSKDYALRLYKNMMKWFVFRLLKVSFAGENKEGQTAGENKEADDDQEDQTNYT